MHRPGHSLEDACKSGCMLKYKLIGAPDGYQMIPLGRSFAQAKNIAPFIEVELEGSSGSKVTVGNESFPTSPNTAVVKSIDFGFGDKIAGKVEIVDEEGGDMGYFLRSIQAAEKCVTQFGGNNLIKFRVGWVGNDCRDNRLFEPSPPIKAAISNIQTTVGSGLIKYTIDFTAADAVLQSYKIDKSWGTEEDPIRLENAIDAIAAYTEGGSPRLNIKKCKRIPSGEVIQVGCFNWVNHGRCGPKACWKANSMSKYDAISDWVSGYRVIDNGEEKGVIVLHDTEAPDTLVLYLDPKPKEGEVWNPTTGAGNFIVNGGKCSNVLEFTPTIDIPSVMARFRAGGSSGGALRSDGQKVEDEKDPTPKKAGDDAGIQTQVVPSQNLIYAEGSKNAQKELNKSQDKHLKAESVLMTNARGGITADLRIVGSVNVNFWTFTVLGKACSITIIDPFHIKGGQPGKSCGDFTKKASCNKFLSNKNWQVQGWSHRVEEGSFVTTLKVMLAAPEFDGGTSGGNVTGADPTGISLENVC